MKKEKLRFRLGLHMLPDSTVYTSVQQNKRRNRKKGSLEFTRKKVHIISTNLLFYYNNKKQNKLFREYHKNGG